MQVIDKVGEIIQFMVNNPKVKYWRVTEISHELDINVSTTHRLLQALKNTGTIHQDNETKKYSLGINLIYFGDIVREMNLPGIIIYPLMERLYEEIGETVFVTIKDQDNCVVIERINSYHQLRVLKRIGESYKLHETPCGKVILAFLPDELLELILERVKMDDISSIDELKATIKKIREDGYLIEVVHSMDCLVFSAPIISSEGNYIASLSTIIPRCRITEDVSLQVVKSLKEIVDEFMIQ